MFKKLLYVFPFGCKTVLGQAVEKDLPVPRFRDPMIQ
jgi:hypothetical protein